jgi:hypothetical protein
MVKVDPGVDHADENALAGRPVGIRRRRPDHVEAAIGEVFRGLEEGARLSAHSPGTGTAPAAPATAAARQQGESQWHAAAPPDAEGRHLVVTPERRGTPP